MERAWDLVIRGGTLIDGSGGAPFEADVAIKDGAIALVGQVTGQVSAASTRLRITRHFSR